MADTKHTKKEIADRLMAGMKKARARGVKFGIQKGTKYPATIIKERAKKEMDLLIAQKGLTLIRAGLIPALGQHFIYRIDEETNEKGKVLSRKHVLVTDPEEIARALDQMEEGGTHPDDAYYYVTAKEPDHKAIEMLLNRAFGKPKESIDLNGEVKFSLKELGKRADELEKQAIHDVSFQELNTGIIVPRAED